MVLSCETIASLRHLKICKHVTPFCQQDMPPANEMMAPLPFTVSETMFTACSREFKGTNSVTATYVLFVELERTREMEKLRKICGGRVQKMK